MSQHRKNYKAAETSNTFRAKTDRRSVFENDFWGNAIKEGKKEGVRPLPDE